MSLWIDLMRNNSLDLIRLAAILLVLGRHVGIEVPQDDVWGTAFVHYWAQGGWVGVDIFFVLSGFLVSGLIFKEWKINQRVNFKKFIIRRLLKVFPSFWVLILLSIIIPQKTWQPISIHSTLAELLFLQNYFPGFWNHTWSLAVEVHFYLSLVLLCRCCIYFKKDSKDPFRNFPLIFFVTALLGLIFRVQAMEIQPYEFHRNLFPTHLRVDSLMFGVLLSWLWSFKDLDSYIQNRLTRICLFVLGIILIIPAFAFKIEANPWISVYGVILFYLGAGMILIGCISSTTLSKDYFAKLAKLGTYSYSIYIWHMPVRESILPQFYKLISPLFGSISWQVNLTLYILGSIIFGLIMANIIEYPMLRARERWFSNKNAELSSLD